MSFRNSNDRAAGTASAVCRASAALLFAALTVTASFAQSSPSKPATGTASVPDGGTPRFIRPETAEQRMTRLGTAEDPGPDPDPRKVFWRFGKAYTIFKADKRFAKYMEDPGWVRPLAQANFVREIYQENDKYVWVWNEVLEPETVDANQVTYHEYSQKDLDYFKELREEFSPIDVTPANVRVRFEESSAGLPSSGSWRNGGAVADMNEDGFMDLVLPPQRGAAGLPSIFLGNGQGQWKNWNITVPRKMNYGSVVVADFNKDRHLDLAFSVHLTGVALFLGDGKGKFREVTAGLGDAYPTRRMIAADVNADGWTDIVAITEGPVGIGKDAVPRTEHAHLLAYLNRKKGEAWQKFEIATRDEFVGGDYLTAGNFNGDRYPDFIGASVYFNSPHSLFLSNRKGEYDPAFEGLLIPALSYFHATAAGRFSKSQKTDDALVSFSRFWQANIDPKLVPAPPAQKISGIDRITFAGGKPSRTPVLRWEGSAITPGMATADFDGDGLLDLAYVRDQAMHILVGDGTGGFKEAEVAGLEMPSQRTYDLKAADVNRDGRPDILLMFEASETTAFAGKDGSVRVYLNRGAGPRGAKQE